ncbi:hypothetical protein COCSADRAFT_34587 [Bipolaris sorokiniana ND90Pr]|uniref:Uncharacterized protein n=1 Tax=Cochliobolus sativus (strain ND90Pr / ATCC 201652) TaxID=665912 RepID=M2TGE8_COCSN|nr:uncharacterized protein COCSADRAFT_34587 [Bipolaris sorokiniana ND90Pr]EMD67802.1 hypothetical protein COCSADRAFT_34587 [Bipolaris sorokiniana ND90Pr]
MPSIAQKAGDIVDHVGHRVHHAAKSVEAQIGATTNQLLPPRRREQMIEQSRDYANRNPKIAAFLTTQAAFTGIPLVLFLAFAAVTLLVSLTTCLFLGLLVSLSITFFVVGLALIFVVPTVFIASFSAIFIFIWGLAGFIILRKFNERGASAKPSTRFGDAVKNGNAAGTGETYADDPTSSGDGGPVSRVHGTVEWDRKWADGVKHDSVVLETDNAYQVLKAETPVPSVSFA